MAKMNNRKNVIAPNVADENGGVVVGLTNGAKLGEGLKFDFKPMTSEQIDRDIKSFAKSGNQILIKAQTLAIAVIKHYIDHGDHTKFGAFITAVNSSLGGSKAKAFLAYVARNVPSLIIGNETDAKGNTIGTKFIHKKGAQRVFHADKVDPETQVSLLNIPFWKAPAEEQAVSFNLKAEIEKLMEKALKNVARVGDPEKAKASDQIDLTGFESFKAVCDGLGYDETYFKMKAAQAKAKRKAA